MTIEQEIRTKAADIEALRSRIGALSLYAFSCQPESGAAEPVFVADLDTARMADYADRYFDLMFGLQRIFARPVELVESQMFAEVEKRYSPLEPVSLDILRATA